MLPALKHWSECTASIRLAGTSIPKAWSLPVSVLIMGFGVQWNGKSS
jgi:hypothetical protein